jgi:Holliday junction resolvasome RuvABC endonuclease subunit
MLICGVDPGTGVRSPTGFAIIETQTREIKCSTTFTSALIEPAHKLKDISEQLEFELSSLNPDERVTVYIESFVMNSKPGETLARLTGALMKAVPYWFKVRFVHNTTVKRLVAGIGNGDKKMVAAGVLSWFERNEKSAQIVNELIEQEAWDQLDALAIAIAGLMRDTQ